MDNEQEELRDILIAISVVAKKLATKLETGQLKEDRKDEKERTRGDL